MWTHEIKGTIDEWTNQKTLLIKKILEILNVSQCTASILAIEYNKSDEISVASNINYNVFECNKLAPVLRSFYSYLKNIFTKVVRSVSNALWI